MLLTPLYLRALEFNQWVADYLYCHRSLLHWDKASGRFCQESRSRHNIPWLLINFGVIGAIWIPSLVNFPYQSFTHLKDASKMEVLEAFFQLAVGIEAFYTAIAYVHYISTCVPFLNKIVSLEDNVSSIYANSLIGTTARRSNQNRALQNRHIKTKLAKLLSEVRLPDGEMDYIGMIVMHLNIN